MGDIVKKMKGDRFIGYYVRYRDADGRRRQRASHQPTRAEARRLLIEIEARVARGLVGIPEPAARRALTVAELCARYLAEYSSPRIKSIESYRRVARYALRPVLDAIGRTAVTQLDRAVLERLRNALGQRYAPNTVRAALRPLGAALSWAVAHDLLPKNPLTGVERPRATHAIEFLSRQEAARLLSEAERAARAADRPAAWCRWIAVALGLYAGLRRGEIYGLRWSDVDLDAGRLTVARSYGVLPKSGAPRHLPLPHALVPLLGEWRARCPPTPERLVCPTAHRGRWGMSRKAPRGLETLLHAAHCQVPVRPWHALRHTYASHFIMAGGNVMTLRLLLGHSSVETTQIYAHLAPDFLVAESSRVKY